MTKNFLTPVLALAVCVAAHGQSRSYSGMTHASGSYSTSSSRSYSSSGGGISSYSAPTRYSSQSSLTRYSSSSSGGSYGSGRYNTGSTSRSSEGFYHRDNYSSAPSGSAWDNGRETGYEKPLPERNAYLMQDDKYAPLSMPQMELTSHNRQAYLMSDDSHSAVPVPKTVPVSNDRQQRGEAYGYALNGSIGTDGGIWVNPFYTPGFSSCIADNDPAYNYQYQLRRIWSGQYLYGVPYSTFNRYCLYGYWIRSGRISLCQRYMQMELAGAKTPAEAVEVMKAYYRCMRLTLSSSTGMY